jgi:integrase
VTAIELRYVKAYPDRHGKMRYYFRRRGFAPVTLPPPGSPGFMAAYEAANVPPPVPIGKGKVSFLRGSLGWAIEQFIASAEFRNRAANTRRGDLSAFNELRATFGAGPLRDLNSRHVKAIRTYFKDKFTPSVADAAIDKLSVVWRFADEHLDLDLDTNPTKGIASVHKHQQANERQPWTPAVFEAFEAHAPAQLRLAVMLLLYTGQRRSDVVKMQWSHFDDDLIKVVQQKTGETVWIPCHRRLKAILDELPRRGDYILTGERSERYEAGSLSTLVRRVLRSAGIRDGFSVHGLRKNAAQCLAEAGCTLAEIMAIQGWKTPAVALLYIRQAEKKRLARSGMARWDEADQVSNLRTKRG